VRVLPLPLPHPATATVLLVVVAPPLAPPLEHTPPVPLAPRPRGRLTTLPLLLVSVLLRLSTTPLRLLSVLLRLSRRPLARPSVSSSSPSWTAGDG
jgi:hypothetical protein